MTRRLLVGCALLVVTAGGCFRTVYRNLEPPGASVPAGRSAPRSPSWRSFFLSGWVPPEVVVDAGAECGGAGRVHELRTRQTFTQGLVETFATSGVMNVYSPWTGEVVCDGGRE
jgi:hypothetical protein